MLTIAGGIIIAVVALVLWRVIAIGAAAVLGVALVLVVGYGLATADWGTLGLLALWAALWWVIQKFGERNSNYDDPEWVKRQLVEIQRQL